VTALTAADVTVVIPTYERRERLHRVLSALARQTDVGFEVVVVSDGSTDGTDEYLRSADTPLAVITERQDNAGPAAARNLGIKLASRELLLFIDDDVMPTPQLVGAHVAAHERLGDRFVVIGPMLNPPDHRMSPWVRWEQTMLQKQYGALERGVYSATARQFYTGNASVRREHVLRVGGFDTSLRRAEDVELAFRLREHGLAFAYEPRAIGLHYAERSFAAWLEIAAAYGRNDVVFARDRGHADVYDWIVSNYHARHRLIRGVTHTCVGHVRTTNVIGHALRGVAAVAYAAHLKAVSRSALSGIYNVAYYRGVADELGGPDELWQLLGMSAPFTAARRAWPGGQHGT
jgi:GT2 family glycosyltransferase